VTGEGGDVIGRMRKHEGVPVTRERVPYECYEGDVAVNLTLAGLDELPAGDEVDLDSIAELWAPERRFPVWPSNRKGAA
jgi:hypothetical protein